VILLYIWEESTFIWNKLTRSQQNKNTALLFCLFKF